MNFDQRIMRQLVDEAEDADQAFEVAQAGYQRAIALNKDPATIEALRKLAVSRQARTMAAWRKVQMEEDAQRERAEEAARAARPPSPPGVVGRILNFFGGAPAPAPPVGREAVFAPPPAPGFAFGPPPAPGFAFGPAPVVAPPAPVVAAPGPVEAVGAALGAIAGALGIGPAPAPPAPAAPAPARGGGRGRGRGRRGIRRGRSGSPPPVRAGAPVAAPRGGSPPRRPDARLLEGIRREAEARAERLRRAEAAGRRYEAAMLTTRYGGGAPGKTPPVYKGKDKSLLSYMYQMPMNASGRYAKI